MGSDCLACEINLSIKLGYSHVSLEWLTLATSHQEPVPTDEISLVHPSKKKTIALVFSGMDRVYRPVEQHRTMTFQSHRS